MVFNFSEIGRSARFLYFFLLFCIGLIISPPLHGKVKNSREIGQIDGTIRGTITDKKSGDPIVGATIMIEGTSTGTVSDMEGNFSLKVSKEKVRILISYIGYEPVTVEANINSPLNLALDESIIDMSEVIVVGYGTQKKLDVSSAISSISSKDLRSSPTISTDALLQGRAAGVQVMTNTGAPGSTVSVKIRGIVTTGNSEPLFVVDGMPMGSGGGDNKFGINSLNPNDIESVQILKDASSAAIYGSRGSNGVVLITTKRGKSGKPVINFESYYGWQTLAKKIDVLDKAQFKQYYDMLDRGVVDHETLNDSAQFANLPDVDWQDEIFDVAPMYNAQLSVSGGGENSKFMMSIGSTKQNGLVGNSDYSRLNFRLNSDHSITKRIRAGESLGISSSNRHRIREGGVGYSFSSASPVVTAVVADPTSEPYDSSGNHSPMLHTRSFNAAGLRDRSNYVYNNKKVNGSVYLEVDIINGLTFKSNLGVDYTLGEMKEFAPAFNVPGSSINEGQLTNELKQVNEHYTYYAWENTLNYSKSIKKHYFGLMAGTTVEVNSFYNLGGSNPSIPGSSAYQQYLSAGNPSDPNRVIDGTAWEWRMYSYLGRINYNFNDRYLLTGSVRQDASSRFGPNKRKATFPAFSAAWKISSEPFLKRYTWLYLAKLRVGWGQVGNQNNIGYYSYNTTLMPNANYPFGTPDKESVPGVTAGVTGKLYDPIEGGKPGNKELSWETTQTTNVGLDLSFFYNKVSLTVDWFVKDNIDMLMQATVPDYLGIRGPDVNDGKIWNRGWEIEAGYRKYEGNLTYDFSFNFTTIKTLVKDMPEPKINNGGLSRTVEGGGMADFWGFKTDGLYRTEEELAKGPYQQNAQVGDIRFKDINQDGIIDESDQTVLGSPLPKFTYGFTSNFYYKNFDLNMFVQGVYGNKIYNSLYREMMGSWGTNKDPDILDSWTPDNPNTDIPRLAETSSNNNDRANSDRWLEDGSFIRLKTISLGYNISKLLKRDSYIQNLRVYLTVQNALTYTKYRGFEPELSEGVDWGKGPLDIGVDNGNYPQPRTYIIGVNLSF